MDKITSVMSTFFDKHKEKAILFMGMLFISMTIILAFFALFPTLYSVKVILLQLVLYMAILLLFELYVENLDDKQKRKGHIFIKIGLVELALSTISIPFIMLSMITGSSAILSVALLASIMIVILVSVFIFSDTGKKITEKLDAGFTVGMLGKKEFKPGDVVLCNIKEEVESGAKDPREILPNKDRFLHMLILGPTGCGKTSQIILPMINQDMQNHESGITVLEPKGDLAIKAFMMAKHYGRDALYFDPTYTNCAKFNPLAGREIDVVENIATTFKMLNPDSSQFFLDLNEQLTRNAVKVLKRLDASEGMSWEGKYANLINLGRLLQNSGGQGLEMVQKFSRIVAHTDAEAKENMDIATWFMNDYFPERSKVYENTSGVRSQVAKLVSNEYLREVMNPDVENGEHSQIDFDKHLKNGTVFCMTTAQGALRDLSKYLGYFLILSLQSSVFRRPGNENTRRHHYLYIDEFQTYSTPGFADMLTQGRSYRVGSILATQARAQMAMGGGKDGKNFVELVSSNARNIVLFPGINKDDAKFYSEQFGEYEKTEVMETRTKKVFNPLMGGFDKLGHPSESIREQKTMTANFTATDLIFSANPGSGFGQIVYCIIKNNSIQPAKVGMVTYIPRELNQTLDDAIADYEKQYSKVILGELAAERAESKSVEDANTFTVLGDTSEELLFFSEVNQDTSLMQDSSIPAADDDFVPFSDEVILSPADLLDDMTTAIESQPPGANSIPDDFGLEDLADDDDLLG